MSSPIALISLPCPPSALSPGVRRLLCEGEAAISGGPESVKAGVLNWDHIHKILPEWVNDTSQYFHEAASRLVPVFLQCEELLCGMTSREFAQRYDHLLQWTGNSQLFLECFQYLSQGSDSDRLLALLMMASALERALGDVFLLKGQQCPSMLKDLLVTPELQDIFGEIVIQILRVVIGPPISLNIRNVAWHGFPAPGEIQDRLCWFLLLLVPSLGERLQQNGVDPLNIMHRTPVIVNQDQLLAGSLPALSTDDLISIEQLFTSTDFVQQQFVPVWHRSLDLYREARYGQSLVLLLPQVEHSLRRVFAAINGCPDRVLTAEATTLYTTFDEILDKYLPSQAENGLLNVIGENSMDLLFDLLVYPDGPRLRDRLSHGEITLDTLPQALADAVIHLTVHLSALLFRARKVIYDPHIASIQRRVSQYQSIFHPIPMAKTKVLDLVALSGVMVTWIGHSPLLEPWTTADGVDVFVTDNVRLAEVLTNVQRVAEGLNRSSLSVHLLSNDMMSCVTPFTDAGSLVQHILLSPISTVYRGQTATNQNSQANQDGQGKSVDIKESEIVGLISRIITEKQEVISQIKVAMETRQQQLTRKQLRSRQRDNLKRLLESLPSLHVMANVLCIMAACLLAHLDQLSILEQTQMKKLQKFLKACLQYTENLRTFTGLDRNKWAECTDLTIKFLPRLVTAVNENMFLGPRSTPSTAVFQST
ncbi:endoplasmic reticulum membrane-associated RNA degradation protein-like [Haliotis rubra]|uniref:endoplasmic reticulum membrane-associated RNA degradation protein-like n=1 Tax=Haliotis rubra TaxID=36100 RepID=UPI001EE560FF|nr:endoplasmic reticulum membrane-associated RNA degradation protein-like [Haliotis rubra]